MSDSMTPHGKPRKSAKKPSADEQSPEQKTASGVSASEDSASESSTDNDSGMSDLERLLAEEGINLGTVEEDRPAGSEGMSAKNWMITTSTETLVRKKLDTELTEETPPPVSPVTAPADNVLETEPPPPAEPTPPPVEPTPAPIETEDDSDDDDEGDPFSIMDFLRSFRKKQKKRG